eukprot:scaffold49425_cov54-Phaeocystis_antarctica.AAC.2
MLHESQNSSSSSPQKHSHWRSERAGVCDTRRGGCEASSLEAPPSSLSLSAKRRCDIASSRAGCRSAPRSRRATAAVALWLSERGGCEASSLEAPPSSLSLSAKRRCDIERVNFGSSLGLTCLTTTQPQIGIGKPAAHRWSHDRSRRVVAQGDAPEVVPSQLCALEAAHCGTSRTQLCTAACTAEGVCAVCSSNARSTCGAATCLPSWRLAASNMASAYVW